ncbi:MAG: nuclease-related domain-containing protein [Ktedonobacterales bacterium]
MALVPSQRRVLRHERQQHRALRRLAYEHQMEAEHWAVGRAGEDHVASVLARHLDDRFVLLRNYTPPPPWHTGGDIDAVLLGSHGVTVFEVKALSGEFRCEGQEWFWRPSRGGAWQEAKVNPSKQAINNARRIRETLRLNGLGHVYVRPVVAVASPNMHVELVPPLAAYIFFAQRRNASIETVVAYANEPQSGYSSSVLQRIYSALLSHVQTV